jgi:hypothetical protein
MKDIVGWTIASVQNTGQHARLFGKKSHEDDEEGGLARWTIAKENMFQNEYDPHQGCCLTILTPMTFFVFSKNCSRCKLLQYV